MLSIYAALNGDFATNGFSDYLGIDYVDVFDALCPSGRGGAQEPV